MEKKRRKIVKEKVEKWKWNEEKVQNEERTFFFPLFKMTEICFGSTKMEIFYQEKAFQARKKSGKINLPPQKNIPVTPWLRPDWKILNFMTLTLDWPAYILPRSDQTEAIYN